MPGLSLNDEETESQWRAEDIISHVRLHPGFHKPISLSVASYCRIIRFQWT